MCGGRRYMPHDGKLAMDDMNPVKRWFRWLLSEDNQDKRKATRHALPGLVAYYWDGATPQPHSILSISSTGLYMITDQQWYRGTLVAMTLQRTDDIDDESERSIAIQAKVVRWGSDGVGVAFVFSKVQNSHLPPAADRKTYDSFLQRFLASQSKASCPDDDRRSPHPPHRGALALELRPKSPTEKRTRSIGKNVSSEKVAFDPSSLPHIADLIDYGEITVGVIEPVGCVATATDGSNCLAKLVRRDQETCSQLMIRLDLAIAKAFTDDIFTDEVNVPPQKK